MEKRWISVKETLPEEFMPVYITIATPDGKRVVEECMYSSDTVYDGDYCFCYWSAYSLAWKEIKDVIAWMPIYIPKPYQGD